jgi:hypothetical protein
MFYTGVSAFINRYSLPQAFNNDGDLIAQYVALYEKPTIYQLLGQELADAFYLDFLAGRFDPAIGEFFSFVINDHTYTCDGLRDIVTAVIYCHYIREQLQFSTSIGAMQPSVEAGKVSNDNYTNTMKVYNHAAKQSEYLVQYIASKPDVYPEFKNGHRLETTWFI